MSAKHPATYTDKFIPIFAGLLAGCQSVLDPFAGVGKLALIKQHGFDGVVVCNEIEPEWTDSPHDVDEWHVGDAADMAWADNASFDAICTSPTYGNRMADHHNARDGSHRVTYRHYLGRELDERNTGRMQWGKAYRDKHAAVYRECYRVLRQGGLMIVNVSDHIRRSERVWVAEWHKQTLLALGFDVIEEIAVETPRMGFGRNGTVRVPHEMMFVFRK